MTEAGTRFALRRARSDGSRPGQSPARSNEAMQRTRCAGR